MQYMLLLYADHNAFSKMTPEQQGQGLAAYQSYMEALTKSAPSKGRPVAADLDRDDGKGDERQTQVLNGPLRGDEGTIGRLLSHRRPRSRLGALVGRALSGLGSRHGRGAPDLGHVDPDGAPDPNS